MPGTVEELEPYEDTFERELSLVLVVPTSDVELQTQIQVDSSLVSQLYWILYSEQATQIITDPQQITSDFYLQLAQNPDLSDNISN